MDKPKDTRLQALVASIVVAIVYILVYVYTH